MIGWVDFIIDREGNKSDPLLGRTYKNMQKDLNRLQQIARRFSKIGSLPQKEWVDVNWVVNEVVTYFRARLPKSKEVNLNVDYGGLPQIKANSELLQWVFENLIRNSIDAMDKTVGQINLDWRMIQQSILLISYTAIMVKVLGVRIDGKSLTLACRLKTMAGGWVLH